MIQINVIKIIPSKNGKLSDGMVSVGVNNDRDKYMFMLGDEFKEALVSVPYKKYTSVNFDLSNIDREMFPLEIQLLDGRTRIKDRYAIDYNKNKMLRSKYYYNTKN